jgi:hypothetical protein
MGRRNGTFSRDLTPTQQTLLFWFEDGTVYTRDTLHAASGLELMGMNNALRSLIIRGLVEEIPPADLRGIITYRRARAAQ